VRKVLLDRPLHEEAMKKLSESTQLIEVYDFDFERLREEIKNADGVICSAAFKIGRQEIASAANLRVIGRPGVGYDNVDIKAATEAGIPVVYVPDGPTESVAEHVTCFMFMLAKKIRVVEGALRERGDFGIRSKVTGIELFGKNMGIIGAGRIGKRVAEIAKRAFSMKIIIYDPFVKDLGDFLDGDYELTYELESLLKRADVISVHIPLNKETEGFIGREQFEMMKRTAIFINTSRGRVVKERDLIDVLREGRIWGAGLDVFEKEPPDPDNPLFELDNVVVTPHLSSFTDGGKLKMGMGVVKGVLDVFEGRFPEYIVNPEVWEKRRR